MSLTLVSKGLKVAFTVELHDTVQQTGDVNTSENEKNNEEVILKQNKCNIFSLCSLIDVLGDINYN